MRRAKKRDYRTKSHIRAPVQSGGCDLAMTTMSGCVVFLWKRLEQSHTIKQVCRAATDYTELK